MSGSDGELESTVAASEDQGNLEYVFRNVEEVFVPAGEERAVKVSMFPFAGEHVSESLAELYWCSTLPVS